MTVVLFVVGVLLLLVGIALSIALHELGHLIPAKKFGVKVTHYMIGFGPTLFSFKRGETVYGVKLLPLGGFIAMPGMYPPSAAVNTRAEDVPGDSRPHDIVVDEARRQREGLEDHRTPAEVPAPPPAKRRARLFERTVSEARELSNQEIGPGEEGRTFYALSVPKRLVVMFGGPVVNFILGVVIFAIVLMGFGVAAGPSTTVSTVVECAVPASTAAERTAEQRSQCLPGDQQTPAWKAGLKPGDTISAINAEKITSWDQMSELIRQNAGKTVALTITRDGTESTLQVPIIRTERAVTDDAGNAVLGADGKPRTEQTGFLGVGPTQLKEPLPVSQFPGQVASMMGQTFHALFTLPQKLVGVGEVAFTSKERDPNGPIGMVGVGRVAGELASDTRFNTEEKAQMGLSLLGSLNFFLFAFNMVPLLPLDGGHIAVGLYEGARRRINLLRRKGPIGPFDTAKLLPLTYVVIALMLGMTLLLAYVDIVKPINLFG